ncbi:hypothetical protein VW29_18225 [Devosia limi DSM 17137]|uniref:Uncharacterized protein n=1 Tax=Devosia limi DSM 17137 TaxID=1121477 RepID=A0A0F5L525_9HYPH|nr:hypothetical protein VW29_18225 [Devosia limi DSM 17137]SHE65413.1 hypothetical protein SAMN02745223_00801 [Devosia limi DSM 17137]
MESDAIVGESKCDSRGGSFQLRRIDVFAIVLHFFFGFALAYVTRGNMSLAGNSWLLHPVQHGETRQLFRFPVLGHMQ